MTKIHRLLFVLLLGVCFSVAGATSVPAQEQHHQSVTHQSDADQGNHVSHTADEAADVHHGHGESHAESADGHGGGHEDHSVGAIIKHNIEHHLVDQPEFELFGFPIDLSHLKVRVPFLDGIHRATAEGNPVILWRVQDEDGRAYFMLSKHMLFMLFAVALVLLMVLPVRNKAGKPGVRGWANVIEALVVFVRDEMVLPNTGEEGRKYMPYFLTVFFFILLMNLLGMLPWGSSATGNLSVTAGLAFCSFILIQWAGIREHGFVGYFKGLIPHGVPWPVLIILAPVELLGLITKPFALCVRLFANMMAGHAVLTAFLGLIIVPVLAIPCVAVAVAISMMEIFVAFLQAYIFTLLTAIFTGTAIHQH